MPSSFFSTDSSSADNGAAPGPLAPTAPWQVYRQQQQQPNQGPAGSAPPATDPDLVDSDEDEGGSGDLGGADEGLDSAIPQDSGGSGDTDDTPAASTAEPLRAERRRSNQLEKELRKARAQLSRFS